MSYKAKSAPAAILPTPDLVAVGFSLVLASAGSALGMAGHYEQSAYSFAAAGAAATAGTVSAFISFMRKGA